MSTQIGCGNYPSMKLHRHTCLQGPCSQNKYTEHLQQNECLTNASGFYYNSNKPEIHTSKISSRLRQGVHSSKRSPLAARSPPP